MMQAAESGGRFVHEAMDRAHPRASRHVYGMLRAESSAEETFPRRSQTMMKRPESHGEQYMVRFQHQSVVDRYHLRPTYPQETFELLNDLIVDEPRAVLDVGCGTGNVARPLAAYVERVDALDLSLPMLSRARTLPGGDSPKIRWLHGRAEEVSLEPPYALVTAGESLHWMEWGVVLPRFARLLTLHGVLAIVHFVDQPIPWREGYHLLRDNCSCWRWRLDVPTTIL